ncbi:helix-turn-helix domain-containing protein [Vagococcus vulneris]|uniref:AraC family transcriptional regulator n=1 Tax=Vagococcus vulneris TaxID=1977869 RepID=A0A430A117_9ENTE|nr:helix-turn-helix domain-containing protein [Vagococcus vulneris]RSU00088.1 AraC family transcriptional regulator [Vagococcus vulneris]
MCYVLIATPDVKERQFIKKIIKQNFFNIQLLPDASTSKEALAVSRNYEISLLILNISSAMEDPFYAKAKILEEQQNIRVILIDDEENFVHLHKSLRCGAIDYLVSPLDKEEVQQSIHRAVLSLNQVSLLHSSKNRITDTKKEQSNQMMLYIHKNYQDAISLDTLAEFSHLNRSYVSRLFKEATNMTVTEYLTSFRLEQAKKLLSTTDLSIAEISLEVGYIDPAYFSRLFKKDIGCTPKKYRQTYQGYVSPPDMAFALQ